MTSLSYTYKLENKKKAISKSIFTLLLIPLSVIISLFLSPYITEYVKDGLRLCFYAVIGSVFPFLILTDIILCTGHFENVGWLRKLFEKTFKINGYAISAFIIGSICGFPLGVKVAADLYKSGQINKDECERLIGFSNNTGPAFVISGIGFSMRNSLSDGIILYASMLVSAIITGIILGIGKVARTLPCEKANMKFSLTDSIKNAGLNTLNISSFVVFFSVICGILTLLIKNVGVYSIFISFLEVSNSAKIFSSSSFFTRDTGLILTSFALSFSGISVHLQAKSFLYETNINMRRYYTAKFIQGVISALITSFVVLMIK